MAQNDQALLVHLKNSGLDFVIIAVFALFITGFAGDIRSGYLLPVRRTKRPTHRNRSEGFTSGSSIDRQ
jgi:hypothetical protein